LIWVQLGSSKRGGNTNQFDGQIDPTADWWEYSSLSLSVCVCVDRMRWWWWYRYQWLERYKYQIYLILYGILQVEFKLETTENKNWKRFFSFFATSTQVTNGGGGKERL
jgi:hypothetical protein